MESEADKRERLKKYTGSESKEIRVHIPTPEERSKRLAAMRGLPVQDNYGGVKGLD